MSWQPLPLTGDPYANVEEPELDGVSASVIDAYVNELGHTVKRPGLETWDNLPDDGYLKVDGLYWWDKQGVVLSVCGGRVFKHTDFTGNHTELTGASLLSGNRVTFASGITSAVMANGGHMVHTDLSTLTQMADGDAPTAVSHVAAMDTYILANTINSQYVNFSEPGSMTSWIATDRFQKVGKPDDLIGLYEGWNELLLPGKESVEVWYDDGVTPFIRRSNGLIDRGVGGAHTFTRVGNDWMWLDDKKRFVKLDQRSPTHISFPYHKLIQSFASVDDAVSDNIEVAGFPLYVTSFPSARKTLAYNYQKDGWAEWGFWNTANASYEGFRGNCYCYAKAWNLHLIGDRANGNIYTMSRDHFTDAGDPIRTLRRTGFISHGTSALKTSNEVVFRLKRGQGNAEVSDPVMTLRWRNHNGKWSNERQLRLGAVGDHHLEARTHRLGEYRYRQYEICHTDATDFVLVDAQEDVEMVA
jgi:hypothetical protein